MPSQEDYLDNLLKDLDSLGINETASDSDILNEGNAILEQMDIPFDEELFTDMPQENIPKDIDAEENLQEDIVSEDSLSEDIALEQSIPEELFAMTQEPVDIEELVEDENANSIGLGDFVDLSEEEIEKFLVQEQESGHSDSDIPQSESVGNIDLMDMLEQSDDGDLKEIHELLQKSDNNEAIEENQDTMFEDTPQDYMDLLGEISGESAVDESDNIMSEKERKAQERKAKKEERKAAKDAKKQARMEAKAVKETQKPVRIEPELQTDETVENIADTQEDVQPVAEDDLADIEALLNMAGAEGTTSSDDPFGFSMEAVMPFATSGEMGAVEDVLKSEESVVLVKKKHPKDTSKKGWFAKFVEFIMEEDEEDEPIERGNEDVQISDENKNIIDEMDKKKKKKKKGQKGNNSKDEEKEGAEGENADEGAEKEKKEKKKKKVKKEKIPAELLEDTTDKKKDTKITPKKVMPIALVCLSVGLVIVLLANLSGDYSVKRAGRKAYYEGDYQTCYQNLYGKELNESEQIMYGKSESILRMRLWLREYELLVLEGAEPEALDSLLESVKNYPALYSYASEWNAGTEVAEIYTKMINLLSAKYHLTEEQALDIANTQNDMEYSKKVYAIADGGAFGSWEEQPEAEIEENLRDVLPEEEELDDVLFLENSKSGK